ncbi:sensor histidine kinase [Allosphingosinicella deserti]|uniref:sensor histidine kinase n=1 Tax=Allosphingosinicella deserti TaxID=2116704 RepID=UPI001E5B9606|nr:HAMP domain-containing sensor histidine kinase [Sphingomonas deserti]
MPAAVIANAAEKRGLDGEQVFTRLTMFKAVDRRTYERSLVAARTHADAAAAAEHDSSVLREQFIAVHGHDLRNPLAALAAGIHMISEKETLSERGELVAKEMRASVSRAQSLIENVLDFARGRLGDGLTLARTRTYLAPVLEQVVSEIRAIAPDREITAHFSIDCDPSRIAQLASNLIANAVTHGASVIPIEVEARSADGRLVFSVVNGGAPIPSAARERLFQPFFRGAVQRRQEGLGLGLFIVNEIAQAHGGTMEVGSSEEETRFTFTMPLSPASSSSASAANVQPPG